MRRGTSGEALIRGRRSQSARRIREAPPNKRIQSRASDSLARQACPKTEAASKSLLVSREQLAVSISISRLTQVANMSENVSHSIRICPIADGKKLPENVRVILQKGRKTKICTFGRISSDALMRSERGGASCFLGKGWRLPQSPITTAATSISTILITSPQSCAAPVSFHTQIFASREYISGRAFFLC